MISRFHQKTIVKDFFTGKAIVLVGPRQVGKTTLVQLLLSKFSKNKGILSLNCDNPGDREILNNVNLNFLEKQVGDNDIIFIDEGQKVDTIGQTVKLLVDKYKKEKQIIVTGSSSLNLLDQTEEFLTGRKFVYKIYPFSMQELYSKKDISKFYKELEEYLIFGSYPEVVNQNSFLKKQKILKELSSSYLYQDILKFENVKNSDLIVKLLKALALQIGREVSYHELSNLLGVNLKIIEKYIDLLEKCFVVFRLPPYSLNKRREITKMNKIYFYDLGMRNMLINNLNPLDLRNDAGCLFENFVIVERLKFREYNEILGEQYFWRTYDGSEVDLIEDRNGKLYGYEIKWEKKRLGRIPIKWLEYKNSTFETLSKEDLVGFIL